MCQLRILLAYGYLEEQEEIKKNCKQNLILENGLVTLPDPVTLQDGWYSAPESLLNTVSDNLFLIMLLTIQVKIMLEKHAEVERVNLNSEHLSNVMTHSISNNIRYTFFRGYCFPEQRTSNKSYDVRVCLHNYTGSILEGACRCVAG